MPDKFYALIILQRIGDRGGDIHLAALMLRYNCNTKILENLVCAK